MQEGFIIMSDLMKVVLPGLLPLQCDLCGTSTFNAQMMLVSSCSIHVLRSVNYSFFFFLVGSYLILHDKLW